MAEKDESGDWKLTNASVDETKCMLDCIDYPEWNKNAIDFNVEVHNE